MVYLAETYLGTLEGETHAPFPVSEVREVGAHDVVAFIHGLLHDIEAAPFHMFLYGAAAEGVGLDGFHDEVGEPAVEVVLDATEFGFAALRE